MHTDFLYINQILDITRWQAVQDALARATKLAIITVDYKGTPVTHHSGPQPFCTQMRSDPELKKYCQRCDSRGGLEAARINAPYIYRCYCDIVDVAIPIMLDGHYIGAVMAGEVQLPAGEKEEKLEKILNPPANSTSEHPWPSNLYQEIPTLSFQTILTTAEMLFQLCGYLVQEAVDKNLLAEMLERQYRSDVTIQPTPAPVFSGYSVKSLELVEKGVRLAKAKLHMSNYDEFQFNCKNPVLHPAVEYINRNKAEAITQKDVAALCHVSPSHFSRLFVREFGEGFSAFLARQKITWAKQLLENTTLSINQVSDELGFSSSGYFIKTFKRYESITPAVYRKYHIDRNQPS